MKVIFTVTKKCQLTIKNRQKVLEIFEFIGKIITKKINKDLKGKIIINLIMKKIFEMMNIEFEQQNKKLAFHDQWWSKIMNVIGRDIRKIIQR